MHAHSLELLKGNKRIFRVYQAVGEEYQVGKEKREYRGSGEEYNVDERKECNIIFLIILRLLERTSSGNKRKRTEISGKKIKIEENGAGKNIKL